MQTGLYILSCSGLSNTIENSNVNDILIYPIPANKYFVIETKESVEMMLYNIYGSKVFSIETIGNQEINIEHLQAGLYFYVLRNKESIVAKGKVIIE